MTNVFVEPLPKGSTIPATGFKLEFAGGTSPDGIVHRTQELAIQAAKRLGHSPLVARVRVTDKGKPDHWRAA